MNYSEAKSHKEKLEEISTFYSKKINSLPRDENGLISNNIRKTETYKEIKKNMDKYFKELQEFNKYFIKNFKKEYLKDRQRKRKVR